MSTLAELKTDLLSLLADSDDNAGWEDGVLEEAIRGGLRLYSECARPAESSFTVTTGGYEQDLSSLNFLQIHSIAYGWNDGDLYARSLVRFRQIDIDTVRFDDCELVVGDVLRVRYQKLHTINGLDGASSTTVPSSDEHPLLLASAYWAYTLRYRQLSRAPSSAPSDVAGAEKLYNHFYGEFAQAIDRARSVPSAGVVWDIGL